MGPSRAALTPIPFVDLGALHGEISDELDAVWREVRERSSFVGGPALERFEREWAAYCNARHAVGVANGTDAIELALRGLGVGVGQEVILPSNTFIATAEAVVAAGAIPRFVDVDPGTLLLTAEAVDAAITSRTAAMIAVHLFGQPADMDALSSLCHRRGLVLLEDAAQAHGARWSDRRVGALGDVACFSFYPGKNLGAFGDAGAVVTDDADLAARVRMLANHGSPAGDRHTHATVGRNSRLDGLQAAVLSTKLRCLDDWNQQRRSRALEYTERFAGTAVHSIAIDDRAESVFHLYVVRVPARAAVIDALTRREIGWGIHYPVPCHEQEAFAAFRSEPLPQVEAASPEILSLPMHPHLLEAQVEEIADVVTTSVQGGHDGG
jgi:dTDP-4-amino-4,6-dideoxygalactose transaminase